MSDEEIEAAALSDPENPPLTPADFKRMKRVPRVKIMRRTLRLSQEEFSAHYRIPSVRCATGSKAVPSPTRRRARN